jgi:hypothetical protein
LVGSISASGIPFGCHFGPLALTLGDYDEAVILLDHNLDVVDDVIAHDRKANRIAAYAFVLENRDLDRAVARPVTALADHPHKPASAADSRTIELQGLVDLSGAGFIASNAFLATCHAGSVA